MNNINFDTNSKIPVEIITITGHGQLLLFSGPWLLIMGIFLILFGMVLIYLWVPK